VQPSAHFGTGLRDTREIPYAPFFGFTARVAVKGEPNAGNFNREISRAMVALFKEYVGRGPTHARSYVHDDLVVVVLQDTMIKAEKTLADEGEDDLVHGVRRVFQDKFREDANSIIEQLTGRKVLCFLSDHAIEEDVVIEAFVLNPEAETDV
jgi:uncharacterized protein YbcI